jgi:hypothetical protein
MKIEEIIKIFLILGVLYLLVNSILIENFSDINPFEYFGLELLSEGKVYSLVNFFDLKDEYKKILFNDLKKKYGDELTANEKNPENKTNNTFLASGIENALISATPETIIQIMSNVPSKIPIIIVSKDKLNDYTNYAESRFQVKQPYINDKGLSPESEKYLYWNQSHQMLFYSTSPMYGLEIKGVRKEEQNKLEIDPININNNDVTLKIVEKSLDSFTYYLISQNEGTEFNWTWYPTNQNLSTTTQ